MSLSISIGWYVSVNEDNNNNPEKMGWWDWSGFIWHIRFSFIRVGKFRFDFCSAARLFIERSSLWWSPSRYVPDIHSSTCHTIPTQITHALHHTRIHHINSLGSVHIYTFRCQWRHHCQYRSVQHNGNEKPAIQTLPCLGLRAPLCWMATLIKPNLTHHWILFQASSVAWNVPMCHPNRNVLIHGQTEQSHIRTASDLMEATTCVALAFSLFFFLGGGGASEFTFCYADNGEYGTERAIIRLSFWLIAIIDSQYIWDAHRHSYEKTKKWIGASSAGIRTGP